MRRWVPTTMGPVLLIGLFVPIFLIVSSLAEPSAHERPLHRPAPGPVSGATLAISIEKAIGSTHSVSVTPVGIDPLSGLWPAFVQFDRTTVSFAISAAGVTLPTLADGQALPIDPRYQTYTGGTLCVATNRQQFTLPWICATADSDDGFASGIRSTLPFSLATYDPYSVVRALPKASVVVVPAAPEDGRATHYRAVLSAGDYLPLAFPTTTKQISALEKGDVEQQFDLLVDEDGRPAQVTVTIAALQLVETLRFSAWGGPGSVVIPAKDRVIDSSELKVSGASPTEPAPAPTVTPTGGRA